MFMLGLVVRAEDPSLLPVRGLHLGAPAPQDVDALAAFIRDALPKEGVNVLVLEVDYGYQYKSHPELVEENALSAQDAAKLVAACKDAGVALIPQINCLGHQSWAERTGALLRVYPEFDETPGKYPGNDGIYCRSYCPRHPRVHAVLFDLMDELAEAFQAKAFHVGMDEVFLLGEDDCPRCRGADKALLFANEVQVLHDHLADKGLTMWMWGDRFIDGESSGIGKWEGSMNGTQGALALIPRDIVICDWHYEFAPPTAGQFALAGFDVVSCPWRKQDPAIGEAEFMTWGHQYANEKVAQHLQGMLQTTWCDTLGFINAYYGKNMADGKPPTDSARESAACFKKLFSILRGQKPAGQD